MKLINIPIEPLDERYSVQWDKWFRMQFDEEFGLHYETVYGVKTKGKIERGSFLDVCDTNLYKASQLQEIIKILQDYDDKEPLVLFFHDLWFPGLESIAYIREGLGLTNLHIVGCLHAGSYDCWDFLATKQMTPWARHMEYAWFEEIADMIFVATDFHKQLICARRDITPGKIKVTGFPLYPDFTYHLRTHKEDYIVFPHRLDPEKHPELFDRVAKVEKEINPTWEFLKSKDITHTKTEYYKLLGQSKIAVSFSDQETWGIAMQEAVLLGCYPVVPRKLSYPEMYSDKFIYDSFRDARHLIRKLMQDPPVHTLEWQQAEILRKGREAIPHMIRYIKTLLDEQSV